MITDKEMMDRIDDLCREMDLLFHNKEFNVVYGAVVHRVGELGIHFGISKEKFLKLSTEAISIAYDDSLNDRQSGKIISTLTDDNEDKKYDG